MKYKNPDVGKMPRTAQELREHPLVDDLCHDGEVWDCWLVKGWCFDHTCHTSVCTTLKDVLNDFRYVQPCGDGCYRCDPDFKEQN